MHKLRRNKVLAARHGLMLAAIDGHETHSSYKRRHEGSLERKVTVGGREMIQYYHRFTVFQLVGKDFYLPLDAEPVLPGDDEVASAMRLLARVLANHPRCFDVLTCDAIYLRPSMIDMVLAAGKHLVATLKDNQPGLLAEARVLLPNEPPEHLELSDVPGKFFHHHGNSILVLWLMMFIAHAVFHCFLRNMQPVLRHAHTAVHFAELIGADLLRDHWWPPHPS